ncbi:ribonuclease E/G [Marinibaculum pumilum]|uniref:Ribonuclease E/G n=1 Tax=Marinibaculum pumilum TaxID=1766165 RepID=A0ABV7L3Q0_9PROT
MAQILLEMNPLELRAARLEGGRVVDLQVVPAGDGQPQEGDVFLGRVRRVDSDLQAAFVEIGAARDGYLDASDARPRSRRPLQRRLQEGQAILVQARHGALADKGAGLTMAVQLPGHRLVLTPTDSDLTVSRRIADAAERQRLRGVLAREAGDPDGGYAAQGPAGCILRTAAAGAAPAALLDEYDRLRRAWQRLQAATEVGRLLAADPLPALLRDWLQPGDAVLALDGTALAAARGWLQDFAPDTGLRLAGPADADASEALEEAVQQALEPLLPLASGARLSIVETPALTAIDLDSGSARGGASGSGALRLNLEAVTEIARQLRLRAIGGLVVIDFLRMRDPRHQAEMLAALRDTLAADPEVGQVLPFSPLGLVELVRRRRGPSLAERLLEPAAPVLRPAAAAALALRRLRAEQAAVQGRPLTLACPPDVARLLPPDRLAAAGVNATVTVDPAIPRHAPGIVPA